MNFPGPGSLHSWAKVRKSRNIIYIYIYMMIDDDDDDDDDDQDCCKLTIEILIQKLNRFKNNTVRMQPSQV